MNKLVASALSLSLGLLAVTAAADNTPMPAQPIQPGVVRVNPGTVQLTAVRGEITVPAPSTFTSSGYGDAKSMANIQCGNLAVVARSVATKPKPPGVTGFYSPQPVWERTVKATGTWSSGKCSYFVVVQGNEAFTLNASVPVVAPFKCSDTNTTIGGAPAQVTVPTGQQKVENFAVTKVNCNLIG